MARPKEDLAGQKFGRLTAIKNLGTDTGRTIWLFRCDCGNEVELWPPNVKGGKTSSCGCFRSEATAKRKTIHGQAVRLGRNPAYLVWNMMLQRCCNENNPNYQNYGGRGIKVCDRWQKFENFLADMGERPDGLTIDRIDNDGNYEPGNCRWATVKEQNLNRRNTRYMTLNGKTQTMKEWSEDIGIGYETLLRRSSKGWPDDLALTVPVGAGRRVVDVKSFKSK